MILHISLSFWCRDLVGWMNIGERIRFRLCIHIPWVRSPGVVRLLEYIHKGSSWENIKSQLVLISSWDSLFALSMYWKKTGNLLFFYSKCVCHLITEGGSSVISVYAPCSCCYWNQNICTFAMTLLFYVLETLIYICF